MPAPDLKVALIAGKTGPLEAYAKETETGFMMGLEYLTGGKMEINGRKIKVIVKDDQGKPDLGRTLLAEAYGDDKVDSPSARPLPARRWRCCRWRRNTRRC
jgi:branched-chain amino acid transport system substrate-binding protein